MDPLTLIVSALAAGAAAGLKPTAEQVIKDAYGSIKALFQRKYEQVDLTAIERKPESKGKQESLREDLADAGAAEDQELLDKINVLLAALEKHAPQDAAAVGVDVGKLRARAVNLTNIHSEGTGVRMKDVDIAEDFTIKDVWAGKGGGEENP